MNKTISACLIAISLVLSSVGVANESQMQPLASKSLLLDVVKINDTTLLAAGERGHILMSTDGITWQQKSVPTQSTITKLFFLDEMTGWAVGHDAVILHTQDGGQSWQLQSFQPKLQRPLLDVIFFDKNHGIAVGAYGFMQRTNDGGKTWQAEYHLELLNEDDQLYLEDLKQEDPEFYQIEIGSILPHFNALYLHQGQLFLAGEKGLLAKSLDQGKSWQLLDEIYIGSFFDIRVINDSLLLASGLRGNLFFSEDLGEQWQQVDVDSIALLNNIVVADNGRVFVLGNAGVVLTSDDGKTFRLRTEEDGKALMSGVWFDNKLVVASEVGIKALDNQ
ncbi:YCF48-related protein [Thalassotalea ponticola]|uniref:WD40/YVTN/BNR-like repeat-containing protein n=1 Tax=Thalassotalea ponticola TaxID=1523392 RepID=UPI0025B401E4|nr:YCF48-related protein [Thalassotalea ponticola]MDN3651380.1 YCF48-related protein [Thalassotalea ponticola]